MYGGLIKFDIIEDLQHGDIYLSLPSLEGDASAVAVRLGPGIMRIGFADGHYYDMKPIPEEVMKKIKEKGLVLVGERVDGQVSRAYKAKVVQ